MFWYVIAMQKTKTGSDWVKISVDEYDMLKKKQEIADDVIFQLSRSLDDMKKGRIKKSD